MDIMRPSLDRQVSPAPWLVIQNSVDVPSLIVNALIQTPDANADDIVKQLRNCGLQVSGIIVSMWLTNWRTHALAILSAADQESVCRTSQATEAEFYCKCDQQICTCDKSRSPRWQNYYCGVRLTANQKKALDQYFDRAAAT